MSEVLEPPVTDPVTAALGALQAALDAGGAADGARPGRASCGRCPVPELLEAAEVVHRAGRRADAVLHGLVREIDARGAATGSGAHSTAGWLRARLHLHPGAARRVVTTSRALHDDPSGALVHHADEPPAPGGRHLLRAAFAAGDITAEHASVACETLAPLAGRAGRPRSSSRRRRFLVEHATRHDPKELARLGRHLRHALDSEETLADDEEHQRARQALVIRQHGDGSSDVRGHLGVELTAELLSQLQPLAGPGPAPTASRTCGPSGSAPPTRWPSCCGGPRSPAAPRPGTAPGPASPSRWRWRPCSAGSARRPRPWTGPGRSAPPPPAGWPATPSSSRSCSARHGEPLDVGRASYPVTQAIWRALVARDGGCAFNGCGRPPEWTEAHHIVHWADGGETSVANCCLFCDHHHHLVHHDGWQVELIDGVDPGDPATLGRPRSATTTQHQPRTRRTPTHPAQAAPPRPALTNAWQPSLPHDPEHRLPASPCPVVVSPDA